ncbi:MAG: alpha/beta fold hydrolase [Erysipelotrichaceae bacterium]|nr:alpha/beta fold hydrolase [Erysipelotrichaceae bacterium]
MKQTVTIPSVRNTQIPCTIFTTDTEHPGLAVFVHGFCAERTEGGRFEEVAEILSKHGFSSIMMDQSGCGESTEGFESYCMRNSMDDIESCISYMTDRYDIDTEKMAMVGYSMGGRIASVYVTEKDPRFTVLGLWAAAIMPFEELTNFVSAPDGHSYYEEAKEKGTAGFLNFFDGKILPLSREFFEDMMKHDTLDCVKHYEGNVIVVHGDADITVDVSVGKRTYQTLTTDKKKELVIIENANHGFGLWDDHPEQSKQLVDRTARFILSCF